MYICTSSVDHFFEPPPHLLLEVIASSLTYTSLLQHSSHFGLYQRVLPELKLLHDVELSSFSLHLSQLPQPLPLPFSAGSLYK
jgi:hypothetical protein